jgi:hypothetical protein
MKVADDCTKRLLALHSRLLAAPLLPKGTEWKGEWPEWKHGETWHPGACGVYVLWETAGGARDGKPPVYVGEGQIGRRVWDSFHSRPAWQYAQILTDELISGTDDDDARWRKAFERFCILVLQPTENRG